MEKLMHKFKKGLYLFAVKKMNFKQENWQFTEVKNIYLMKFRFEN